MYLKIPILLGFLFTSQNIFADENTDQPSNIGNEVPIIFNYQTPVVATNTLGTGHNGAYLYGVLELYTKLDTVMKLLENGFGKTNERIEKVEQKLGRLELLLNELGGKLDQFKTDQLAIQYLADRFNKLYNVNTETYTICKEAVQNPKKSGIFNSNARSQTNTYTQPDHVVVQNGGLQEPRISKEQEEMIFVISTVANVTIDKYYRLMERKMAEEFDVISFQIREKLDPNEESLSKIKTVSKHLLDANDQINSALLEIKDQINDEQSMISSLETKINDKFDEVKQIVDKKKDHHDEVKPVVCEAESSKNSTEILQSSIRSIFEEYLNKSVLTKVVKTNEITGNWGHSESQNPRERMGKESKTSESSTESSTQPRSVSSGYLTTPKPKDPIKFVTISMGYSGEKHFDELDDSGMNNSVEDSVLTKPEFRPSKTTSFSRLSCTVKSAISYPKSCAELRQHGATCDAVYVIIMRKFALKHVYCDMRHLQGGWTVILRRGRFANTKQITFDHTYPAYRSGFGDMHLGEFFLGLDTIYQLTNEDGPHTLQIDLEDVDGEYLSLQYNNFRIGGLGDDFRFYVDGIRDHDQGHTTISVDYYRQLASVLLGHNGTKFLTSDRVRKYLESKDQSPPSAALTFASECAQVFQSGWWYGPEMFTFGVSKNDACRMTNGFQLMAPMDSTNKNRATNTHAHSRSHGHSYNHQVALAQHSHGTGQTGLHMYWSKWTHTDGTPRTLKYVLMKIRSSGFSLKNTKV